MGWTIQQAMKPGQPKNIPHCTTYSLSRYRFYVHIIIMLANILKYLVDY